MKKCLLGFVLFVGMLIPARGQSLEELEALLAVQPRDSNRVNTLTSTSLAYLNSDIDQSLRYANEAVELARQIEFRKGEAYALKARGQANVVRANFPEAIESFKLSLSVFNAINFKQGIANILSNLGGVHFNSGDDTKALEYYLESLRVSEAINDSLRIAILLNNIGGVYQNKDGSLNTAKDYFLRALPIFRSLDFEDGIGIVSMNLGETYAEKNMYDSAMYFFQNSLEVYRGTIDATFPLNYMGKIYAVNGEFEKAIESQSEALDIAENLNAKLEMTQVLLGMAETKQKQKAYDAAINLFHKAESLAHEINAKNELKDAYEGLANTYSVKRSYQKAFEYETLFAQMKDTLYNTANDKKIQQLQFNFDIEKKQAQIDLLTKDNEIRAVMLERQTTLNIASAITVVLVLILAYGVINRSNFIRKTNRIINSEKEKSEELLLNILPAATAHELQQKGHAAPRYYEEVTVVFTDFRGFSTIASSLSPQELVTELNEYFVAFDEIVGNHNLEKIKTMGDAYMCAGGIPTPNATHAFDAIKAAFEMQKVVEKKNVEKLQKGLSPWELRIGIHTGPVVAGVVGRKKYAYDIWGDTVNIASRMETNSRPGRVNISEATFNRVKENYRCEYRGKISAKNIGNVDMYFVEEEIVSGSRVKASS